MQRYFVPAKKLTRIQHNIKVGEIQLYISPICDNTVTTQNFVIFQERRLKGLKCYNFL